MGDGSAIGGWILAAAIVTVLAGGASAAGGSGSSGSSSGSRASGVSGRSTTSASRTASASGTGRSGGAATGNGSTRPAAPCTAVSTVLSTDGKRYHRFPVSADGSYLCGLEPADSGPPVRVLQQALALCSDRAVKVDGTYSADTRGAVKRDQRRQLGPKADGVYGPATAKGLRWPWFAVSNDKFSGHCALAGERAG